MGLGVIILKKRKSVLVTFCFPENKHIKNKKTNCFSTAYITFSHKTFFLSIFPFNTIKPLPTFFDSLKKLKQPAKQLAFFLFFPSLFLFCKKIKSQVDFFSLLLRNKEKIIWNWFILNCWIEEYYIEKIFGLDMFYIYYWF